MNCISSLHREKQAVKSVVGPTQYATNSASGDLNGHPQLSALMSQYATGH